MSSLAKDLDPNTYIGLQLPLKPSNNGNLSSTCKARFSLVNIFLKFEGISARNNAVLETGPNFVFPTNSCFTRNP